MNTLYNPSDAGDLPSLLIEDNEHFCTTSYLSKDYKAQPLAKDEKICSNLLYFRTTSYHPLFPTPATIVIPDYYLCTPFFMVFFTFPWHNEIMFLRQLFAFLKTIFQFIVSAPTGITQASSCQKFIIQSALTGHIVYVLLDAVNVHNAHVYGNNVYIHNK